MLLKLAQLNKTSLEKLIVVQLLKAFNTSIEISVSYRFLINLGSVPDMLKPALTNPLHDAFIIIFQSKCKAPKSSLFYS
jgi:hypothetical protein